MWARRSADNPVMTHEQRSDQIPVFERHVDSLFGQLDAKIDGVAAHVQALHADGRSAADIQMSEAETISAQSRGQQRMSAPLRGAAIPAIAGFGLVLSPC